MLVFWSVVDAMRSVVGLQQATRERKTGLGGGQLRSSHRTVRTALEAAMKAWLSANWVTPDRVVAEYARLAFPNLRYYWPEELRLPM